MKVNCLICNKEFDIALHEVKLGHGKYCSRKCQGISCRNSVEKKCLTCGKEYSIKLSRELRSKSKYCCLDCYNIAKKGKPTWISKNACKGKRMNTGKTIFKINDIRLMGEANSSWKGGITPEITKIRTSIEMDKWKQEVYKKNGYTCQMCGQVGGKLVAHHIYPFRDYPNLRLNLTNGITLCKKCHSPTVKKEYQFIPQLIKGEIL